MTEILLTAQEAHVFKRLLTDTTKWFSFVCRAQKWTLKRVQQHLNANVFYTDARKALILKLFMQSGLFNVIAEPDVKVALQTTPAIKGSKG